MRRVSMTATALAALALTLALRAETPNVYAIRGARIVTVSGTTLDEGNIVMRGGLIESVGTAAPPSDAEVIDGKGLTVYPGLIDLGNTRVADQAVPQPPANIRTTAELERWKATQIVKPNALAADVVKVDDPELTTLASAGITSVLAIPSGDVITGRSALVNVVAPPDDPQIGNVAGDRRRQIVVRSPVALHVTFPNRPRAAPNAYPESLMGVIAFVRQEFLDAQHYGLEKAHEERVRTNDVRRDQDPVFEAMLPALDHRLPVAFEANEAREILRVLKLARELKLDAIITGGRDAGAVAADLKAQMAPVIFSLNYPQRSRLLAPDADESITALRARADAPKVPAALAKGLVLFAFESAGLTDPKDFVRNAAKAVKAGLSPTVALRALTLNAAMIAGASDLGSIEKGKIANLVVTDGDLFDEKTKVTRVFVNGRAVALDAAAPAPGGRGRGRGGD